MISLVESRSPDCPALFAIARIVVDEERTTTAPIAVSASIDCVTRWFRQTRYPRNNDGLAESYEAVLTEAAQFLTPEQLMVAQNYFHGQAEMLHAIQKLIPPQ